MDVCAIMKADDELLKDMGLLKAGDRLSLRGFCRSHSQSEKKEDNQSKKRRLLEAFFEKKKGKKAGPSQKFTGRSHTSKIGRSEKEKTKKVLSRWSDYLQDIEDGEDSIHLSDILFFATGCRTLPPRKISPTIEFLHEPGTFGHSRFPKANTCSATLRLPVIHESYEAFKADMSFGIQNGRGFGSA